MSSKARRKSNSISLAACRSEGMHASSLNQEQSDSSKGVKRASQGKSSAFKLDVPQKPSVAHKTSSRMAKKNSLSISNAYAGEPESADESSATESNTSDCKAPAIRTRATCVRTGASVSNNSAEVQQNVKRPRRSKSAGKSSAKSAVRKSETTWCDSLSESNSEYEYDYDMAASHQAQPTEASSSRRKVATNKQVGAKVNRSNTKQETVMEGLAEADSDLADALRAKALGRPRVHVSAKPKSDGPFKLDSVTLKLFVDQQMLLSRGDRNTLSVHSLTEAAGCYFEQPLTDALRQLIRQLAFKWFDEHDEQSDEATKPVSGRNAPPHG